METKIKEKGRKGRRNRKSKKGEKNREKVTTRRRERERRVGRRIKDENGGYWMKGERKERREGRKDKGRKGGQKGGEKEDVGKIGITPPCLSVPSLPTA